MIQTTDDHKVRCPNCDGAGYTVEVRQGCCGNYTDGGDCRGDCSIQEQYQEGCTCCQGEGWIEP